MSASLSCSWPASARRQLGPRSKIIRDCGVTLRPHTVKYKLITGLSSADNPRLAYVQVPREAVAHTRDGLDPKALR